MGAGRCATEPERRPRPSSRRRRTLATRNGVSSTPSFLLGRTGGALRPLNVTSLSASSFTGPIDKVAA